MSLKSQIRRQIKNMPKYTIQGEAFQNQAIARTSAFGQNRDVQMQQQNIDQSAADAVSQAQDVTANTSDLLSTIAAIDASKNSAQRDLAITQAGLRRQGRQELYGANTAMIDEKDKAFYQNVYAPWEAKLRNLQQRKANRTAFWNNIAGGLLGAAGYALGGPIGGAIASKIGGSLGKGQDVQNSSAFVNTDASLYGYDPYRPIS